MSYKISGRIIRGNPGPTLLVLPLGLQRGLQLDLHAYGLDATGKPPPWSANGKAYLGQGLESQRRWRPS